MKICPECGAVMVTDRCDYCPYDKNEGAYEDDCLYEEEESGWEDGYAWDF